MHITITDPADMFDVVYDGPADTAHDRLIPGIYAGTDMDARPVTVVVYNGSTVVTHDDE